MLPEEWIGRTLARTYLIEKTLGSGGMGAVYQAKHLRIDKMVAVKILKPDFAAEEDILRRFRIEAKIISELRHPHIVQVHDFYEQNEPDEVPAPFLVMDFLEGEDLHSRLRRCGRLTYVEACKLALEVGSALHAAHSRDIVHRDIKPMNLFIHRQDAVSSDDEVYKVVDFGISKIQGSSRQTPTLMFMGTPHYAAPEAASSESDAIDGRSDQFSLAVVLYRALTGRLPFEGRDSVSVLYQVIHHQPEPIGRLLPALPPHAAQAIDRALAKRKDERFASIWEFAQAFAGNPRSSQVRRESRAAGGAAIAETVRLPPVSDRGAWPSALAIREGGNSQDQLEASRLTPNSLTHSSGQAKPKARAVLRPVVGGLLALGATALIGLGIWTLRTPTVPVSPPGRLPQPSQPERTVTTAGQPPPQPQLQLLAQPKSSPPLRRLVTPPELTPKATAAGNVARLRARAVSASSPDADRRSNLGACGSRLAIAVQPPDSQPALDHAFRDFLRQTPLSKDLCPCPRILQFQRNSRRGGRFVLQGQPGAGVSEVGLDTLLTWLNEPRRVPWDVRTIQLGCRPRDAAGSPGRP